MAFPKEIKYSFSVDTYQLGDINGYGKSLIDSSYIFVGDNIWVEKSRHFRMIFDFFNGTVYFVDDSRKIFAGGKVESFFKEMKEFYEKYLEEFEKNYKIKKEDVNGDEKIALLLESQNSNLAKYEIKVDNKKLLEVKVNRNIKLDKIFSKRNFDRYFLKFLNVSSILEKGFYSKKKFKFEEKLDKILFEIYRIGFPTEIVEYRDGRRFYLTDIKPIVDQEGKRVYEIDNSYNKKSFAEFEKIFFDGD